MYIYLDGIFDLFHVGHVRAYKYIKTRYPNSKLIIGIINDKDATDYKRKPIINENQRCEMILSTCYVDKIIFPAPLIITPQFLEDNNIDLVVHGFANREDAEKQKEFFKEIKDKFQEIPYNFGRSTTEIIKNIKENY
jgi:choline-phosphate cytidylyltransferase